MLQERNLVAAIYYHPEAYPPTLNAIAVLSRQFNSISLVHRPHLKGNWQYPANVTAIASGSYITSREQEMAGLKQKVLFFYRFVSDLLKECRKKRPAVILLYDTLALYAYKLIRPLLRFKHILWYHNHDVAELATTRKYSISWLAIKGEQKLFNKIDLFTLPAAERLQYFPMDTFRGRYFIIPNYPAVAFYSKFYQPRKLEDEVRILFQGRIGDGHGFETIIPLLANQVANKKWKLILKGHCDEAYKQQLIEIATTHQVADKITFVGFTPYEDVPKLAATCHIGIGIFANREIMHLSLGTASNKLYEYAAVGLPVIYLAEEHFSRYLHKYQWAFPVTFTPASIVNALEKIVDNYTFYSSCAYHDFQRELNFEHSFEPVSDYLKSENLWKRGPL
jgi:glycosyltransferase involved in cell wall biosynthesis